MQLRENRRQTWPLHDIDEEEFVSDIGGSRHKAARHRNNGTSLFCYHFVDEDDEAAEERREMLDFIRRRLETHLGENGFWLLYRLYVTGELSFRQLAWETGVSTATWSRDRLGKVQAKLWNDPILRRVADA